MATQQQNERQLIHLPPALPIDIEFSDVGVAVDDDGGGGICFWKRTRGKKYLLKGVSGRFQSGELTAIMGPSGAGKTTLLNVLTGFSTKGMSGCVRALGSLGAGGCLLRKQSCYIMQDDRLLPHLTTLEALEWAAKLRLPRNTSPKTRKLVVDDILETLGLSVSASVRCCRLSGGQRKRMSIALELVNNPPVIFLDEPLTGLDSSSSVHCMQLLKQLARGGRTVVMTLHQPSAFLYEMLDHVYVLGPGGACVYRGAPEMTVAYLANVGLFCPLYHSPADFSKGESRWRRKVSTDDRLYSDSCIISDKPSVSDPAWEMVSTRDEAQIPAICVANGRDNPVIDTRPVSELTKYRILLGRSLYQIHCEWAVTQIRAVFHLLVGALLGAMYSGAGTDGGRTISNISFLLVSLVYLTYTAMMPAVLRFPSELPVIQKEHFNNWYSLSAYYTAFLTASTPVQMIHCLLFCSVAYFGSGQPNEINRFLMYLLVCELVMLTAEGFGLLIGSMVNPVNGTFLGAMMIAVDIVLSGFFVLVSDMLPFFQWISNISFLHQGFEALVISVYGFDRGTLPCPDKDVNDDSGMTYCHYRYPSKVLETFSVNTDNYWVPDVVVLLIWVIFLRIFGFFCLRRRISSG